MKKNRCRSFIDLTGKIVGKLTVTSYSHLEVSKSGVRYHYWNVKCECGVEKKVRNFHFKTAKSCGCLRNIKKFKHDAHRFTGLSKTRFYSCWNSMMMRCYSPSNQAFRRYGAKGINVCDEWKKFGGYVDDLYQSYKEHCEIYGEKETSLDRIDNSKGYFKENCRWATHKEQSNNISSNISNKFLTDNNNNSINYLVFCKENKITMGTLNRLIKKYNENDIIISGGKEFNIKLKKYQEVLKEKINEIEKLNKRHQEVLKLRYGIEDNIVRSLESVGKIMGITRERVRQLESKALINLSNLL